jgi:hypothetical protein
MLQAALSPICRLLLKRGLGVGTLIEAAKIAYIHAAVKEIFPADTRVNVSRLSVVTGLTRKEIAALLRQKDERSTATLPKRSLQQRAFRVLQGWSIDHAFQRPNGRPADLPIRGGPQSFHGLVARYGGDVTPVSVLRELERMGVVKTTSAGVVKFRRRNIESKTHFTEQMAEFTHLFRDFVNTVQQISEPKDPPLFFGFKDSILTTPHQAALFQRTFSKRAATLLESIDQWIAHQNKSKQSKHVAAELKTRVGLGVYLIQGDE